MILALAGQFKQLSHEPEKFSDYYCTSDFLYDWLIDSLLFEYGNFVSYITSLHESCIETEVNTIQLH